MRTEAIAKNLVEIVEGDDSLKFLPSWQVRCLIPLALGRPISAIALEAGKTEADLKSALKTALFKSALAIASIQIYQLSGELCAASSIEAVLVLREVMHSSESKAGDRIKAAQILLDRADIRDRWQLSERIAKLEESS